jgi:hypothetical protein
MGYCSKEVRARTKLISPSTKYYPTDEEPQKLQNSLLAIANTEMTDMELPVKLQQPMGPTFGADYFAYLVSPNAVRMQS